MAKPNAYLAKQAAVNHGFFEAGLQCGRQQILDMMCLSLREKEVVGKDTFGKDRLLKLIIDIGRKIDCYQKAWGKDDETDYYREKLDRALAEAFGEQLHDTFMVRYPYSNEFNYKKGKWNA